MPELPRVHLRLPVADEPHADVASAISLARRAEGAGFDGVVVSDHVVIGPRTDRYPWGNFAYAPDAPWPEPLVALAAMAAVTERIRLGTQVLIAPLRPAALLAKAAATLDALSGGRLDLGVGTGWQQEEFEAEGVDFAARGAALTDTMGACRALWGPGPATFRSATASLSGLWCQPRPARPGGPVVLFSGTLTPRNVRRVVELGDGWIPIMGETPEGVQTGVAQLRGAFADAGRDPATLRVHVGLPIARGPDRRPDLDRTLAGADQAAAGGATDVVLAMTQLIRDDPAALDGWFERAQDALSAWRGDR